MTPTTEEEAIAALQGMRNENLEMSESSGDEGDDEAPLGSHTKRNGRKRKSRKKKGKKTKKDRETRYKDQARPNGTLKNTQNNGRGTSYNHHELVTDKEFPTFVARCKAQLNRMGLEETPENEKLDFFGCCNLDTQTKVNYKSKLRRFVRFLMANPLFDDSLVVFHYHTPKGSIAVQDVAARFFMLAAARPSGEPVLDKLEKDEPQFFLPDKTALVGLPGQQWSCCENFAHFRAALTHVHSSTIRIESWNKRVWDRLALKQFKSFLLHFLGRHLSVFLAFHHVLTHLNKTVPF